MSIASYTALQSRITELLNRDDLDTEVPGFIGLAEAEISRDLRDHWRLERRTSQLVSARYVALPSDWQGAVRLEISYGGYTRELDLLSTAEMAALRRTNNLAATPTNYAITGGELELYPTPDQEYTLDTAYRGGLTPLSADAPSNWLLAQAPDAYLYGSAKHSAPWLRDDPRLAVWEAFYRTAVTGVADQAREAKHSGTGLRMKIKSY